MELQIHIGIATPMMDGNCTQQYAFSLAETVKGLAKRGVETSLLATKGVAVAQARNRLVAAFLARPQMTHLLFIDNDHGWKPEDVYRLIAMEKEVIGIVARKKKDEFELAANILPGMANIDDRGSMEITGGIGTGFLMIERSALEYMIKSYSHLKMQHPDPKATPEERDNYYRLFEFTVIKDRELSEDLTFCERWKEINGKIWCDPDAEISHIGTKDYRGGVASLLTETEESA